MHSCVVNRHPIVFVRWCKVNYSRGGFSGGWVSSFLIGNYLIGGKLALTLLPKLCKSSHLK